MKDNNSTLVDRIWFRIKNNSFLAVIIIASAVIAGIASFSDNVVKLFKNTDALIPDRQKTSIIGSVDVTPAAGFEHFFNTSFEIANNDQSDVVNLSREDISIDFSINNEEGDLKYTIRNKDKQIIINPHHFYLSLLKDGGPVEPVDYFRTPFDFQFPVLDFKITNNSDQTIFFTRAVFAVSGSKPDPFPVILIQTGNNMYFPIQNIGWGKVYNCKLYFNLETSDTPADFTKDFKNELFIGDFDDRPESIDLSQFYKELGVNTDFFQNKYTYMGEGSYRFIDETGREKTISEDEYESIKLRAGGPFRNGYSKIIGEMHYEGMNAAGNLMQEKFRFEGIIELDGGRVGMPVGPSYVYDVNLEADKDNYSKEVPLSQAIKPGEFDRFDIRICAPQSSRHQFNLTLFYNDNKQFTVPGISMNYFMSKPDSRYIANAEQ